MANRKNLKKRKRKHHTGNQYTNKKTLPQPEIVDKDLTVPQDVPPEQPECASAKKIRLENPIENDANKNSNYNFIMDFSILEKIIRSTSSCKICNTDAPLTIVNNTSKRRGFALCLELTCPECLWSETFYSSKEAVKDDKMSAGRKPLSINLQMVVAFREIGKGFQPMENFSRIVNMPIMSKSNFDDINSKLMTAYKDVANESMNKAGEEVHSISEKIDDGLGLCRVSLDGSWQRRGHASLNGLVTTISNGKCIDVEVMTKFCRGCAMWQGKKDKSGYKAWEAEHQCVINHTKSSGAMEGAGAVKMFERSVEKHKLVYNEYLGDGDTSSFKEVVDAKPYEKQSVSTSKLECVGHVQKRLGTRLRKIVKDYRREEKVIKKGKEVTKIIKLSGKGKLTDTIINSMQNYYGMAIRGNIGNVYAMKKAIGAVLFHCTEIASNETRHKYCPKGDDTWCKWQLDKLKGTKTYKPHIGIPKWIHDIIYPIFVELRHDNLLAKCLHGQTQNNNEALNQIIWTKVPKAVFVGKSVLSMGVYSAVIEFNDGSSGVHKVLESVGVEIGKYTRMGTRKRNKRRIAHSLQKSSEKGKKRRKGIRTVKKGFADKEKELEKEDAYATGGFDLY